MRPVSLLIHELAENLDFSINGVGGGVPYPDPSLYKKKATRQAYIALYNGANGVDEYDRAHGYAISREVQIRRDLTTINGGYAGGALAQR